MLLVEGRESAESGPRREEVKGRGGGARRAPVGCVCLNVFNRVMRESADRGPRREEVKGRGGGAQRAPVRSV